MLLIWLRYEILLTQQNIFVSLCWWNHTRNIFCIMWKSSKLFGIEQIPVLELFGFFLIQFLHNAHLWIHNKILALKKSGYIPKHVWNSKTLHSENNTQNRERLGRRTKSRADPEAIIFHFTNDWEIHFTNDVTLFLFSKRPPKFYWKTVLFYNTILKN